MILERKTEEIVDKKTIVHDRILRLIGKTEEFENYEEMTAEEMFEALYHKYIQRDGADSLLKYIQSTDFYSAPARTRYHGSYKGGLVEHSLHVYYCYKSYLKRCSVGYGVKMSEESIALVSLMHDLCKAGVYKTEMRNKKIDGVWKQVPTYVFEDEMPLGHGQKSAYLVMQHCQLSPVEYAAIAFHMGCFDGCVPNNVGQTFSMYPEAFALSVADQEATYFVENEQWVQRNNL